MSHSHILIFAVVILCTMIGLLCFVWKFSYNEVKNSPDDSWINPMYSREGCLFEINLLYGLIVFSSIIASVFVICSLAK